MPTTLLPLKESLATVNFHATPPQPNADVKTNRTRLNLRHFAMGEWRVAKYSQPERFYAPSRCVDRERGLFDRDLCG
jgi:hypothetical protein